MQTLDSAQDTPVNGAGAPISRALYVTLLIALIGPSLSFVTLPPALPLVADYFGGGGAGRQIAQMALALCFAGGTVSGLLAGAIIARLHLRTALVAAGLLYASGGGVAMSAMIPATLFAGCLMVGFAGALLSSGLAMATGAVLIGEARAKMLGFQAGTSDVVGVVMSLAAGTLAQLGGWRAPLGIYIGFGLFVTMLILLSKPKGVEAAADDKPGGFLAALRLAWPIFIASLLLSLLIGTLQLQLPFHLDDHGLGTATSRGLVQMFITFAAACASLSFGFARARLGERRILMLGALGGVCGFGTYALWHGGLYWAIGAALACGVGIGVSVPLLFTAALRKTPPILHGYTIGILNTTIFLGAAVSPLFFEPIVALAGQAAVFFVSALLAGGGAAIILFFLSRPARVLAPSATIAD